MNRWNVDGVQTRAYGSVVGLGDGEDVTDGWDDAEELSV